MTALQDSCPRPKTSMPPRPIWARSRGRIHRRVFRAHRDHAIISGEAELPGFGYRGELRARLDSPQLPRLSPRRLLRLQTLSIEDGMGTAAIVVKYTGFVDAAWRRAPNSAFASTSSSPGARDMNA